MRGQNNVRHGIVRAASLALGLMLLLAPSRAGAQQTYVTRFDAFAGYISRQSARQSF